MTTQDYLVLLPFNNLAHGSASTHFFVVAAPDIDLARVAVSRVLEDQDTWRTFACNELGYDEDDGLIDQVRLNDDAVQIVPLKTLDVAAKSVGEIYTSAGLDDDEADSDSDDDDGDREFAKSDEQPDADAPSPACR